MIDKQSYVELHTLEWDILNSACKDCYINNLECLYYSEGCRKK